MFMVVFIIVGFDMGGGVGLKVDIEMVFVLNEYLFLVVFVIIY